MNFPFLRSQNLLFLPPNEEFTVYGLRFTVYRFQLSGQLNGDPNWQQKTENNKRKT